MPLHRRPVWTPIRQGATLLLDASGQRVAVVRRDGVAWMWTVFGLSHSELAPTLTDARNACERLLDMETR